MSPTSPPSSPLDPDFRAGLIGRIVELILGDPADFTREEAAQAAGFTVDEARRFWRAFGFPDVGTARAFTPEDVASLRQIHAWIAADRMNAVTAIDVMRSLGQTASRLADWQVDTFMRVVAESPEQVELERIEEVIQELLPGMEKLLVYSWRRQVAAVIARGLPGLAEADTSEAPVATVGFADIAGFTRLVRAMRDEDLSRLVHDFETGAADLVTGEGARLVKTLGDEVMFVCERADTAGRIAIRMHDLRSPGPEPLQIRIGLATGEVISRMGDYYGRTVNRASRLTAIARPGTTIIDVVTEESLAGRDQFAVRHLTPRRLRGLGLVRVSSLAAPKESKLRRQQAVAAAAMAARPPQVLP